MQFFSQINKDEGSLIMKQLCYASCSTSSSITLLEDLRNILSEALGFSTIAMQLQGCCTTQMATFFSVWKVKIQCLSRWWKLRKEFSTSGDYDLWIKTIDQRHFTDWSMKYVSRSSHALQYLHEQGNGEI